MLRTHFFTTVTGHLKGVVECSERIFGNTLKGLTNGEFKLSNGFKVPS